MALQLCGVVSKPENLFSDRDNKNYRNVARPKKGKYYILLVEGVETVNFTTFH